jgi:DNA invertase Pin-like site-specific DNA recombinase
MTAKPTVCALYSRVSTGLQHCENQRAELQRYAEARGFAVVEFSDTISGATSSRPGLDTLMQDARRRTFKVVIVWSLDRLGRNLKHLIETLDEFAQLGIEFVSLRESIDTSSAAGRLQLTILAALASFERERLRERTIAGLQRARNEGKQLGRPRVHPIAVDGPTATVRELAASWGVSKSTAARWLVSGRAPAYVGQTSIVGDGVSL